MRTGDSEDHPGEQHVSAGQETPHSNSQSQLAELHLLHIETISREAVRVQLTTQLTTMAASPKKYFSKELCSL